MTPPTSVECFCGNIVQSSSVFSYCEHCITSTNCQCRLETFEICLSRLQELEKLSRVSWYLRIESLNIHKVTRVSVLQKSADIIETFT
jgi:hypothetical protein